MNVEKAQKARFCYVDRIKVLGLLLVILAHVEIPQWLSQFRDFDVPLLVFASAYLARISYREGNLLSYYKKRFFRLAVPAWIFTMFFWMVQSVILTPPTLGDMLNNILFQRETLLSFLWVIWVYIVCALLIPLCKKAKPNRRTGIAAVAVLLVFQILCSFTRLWENPVLNSTFFTVIPYGLITWLGYYYRDFSKKTKWTIGAVSSATFAVFAVALGIKEGQFVPTFAYKYPAQIYYLSYAMPIILALFAALPKLDKYPTSPLVRFISSSSLWIYLWHTLILYAVKMVIENDAYWPLQYVLILGLSVLVTWTQNKTVLWLEKKTGWNWLRVLKG